MIYRLLFLSVLGLLCSLVSAQTGRISGRVINGGTGTELSGATLLLVQKNKSISSDKNGAFSFVKLESGAYSIQCTYQGFDGKIVDDIIVKNGEVTVITISLSEVARVRGEIVVTAPSRVRAAGESVVSLLAAQKSNPSVSDGISSESIRKTPDRVTSDVIKRVSGASIQDDRFAIIRGLNDRYNAAFINGAPLPSTESDRKAFSFDIFPSAILDNLIIYKTATPDKTGDFAGGIIDITTKGIPNKNFTSVSIGGGYNSLITGNQRIRSEAKGKTDWLGIDDGVRGIPSGIPGSSELITLNNNQRAELARLFNRYKWGLRQTNTLPNMNLQISQGLNFTRNDQDFIGALFSVNYSKNFSYNDGNRDIYALDKVTLVSSVSDSVYNDETIVGVLANFSIKINSRHSFFWKNNLSINADNRLIKRVSVPDVQSDPNTGYRDAVRAYTSNKISSSQIGGDHQVGKFKTRINWLGSFSKVIREIPNYSRTSYLIDPVAPSTGFAIINVNPSQLQGAGTMFFVNSNEKISSIKAEASQAYKFMGSLQNTVRLGGGFQKRERDFTSRLLGFSPYSAVGVPHDFSLYTLPEDQIFAESNFGKMSNGKGGFLLREANSPNNNYDASSELLFGYLMNDQRFFKKFRLIYGLRMEQFNQQLNSPSGVSGVPSQSIDTTVTDLLPSVNLVYALNSKINIRLSYAGSVNRPEFRELAPFLFYDYQLQYSINGDTRLRRANIKNYDFRFEFFPGKAQLFSVSAFYKDFTNPIEVVFTPDIPGQAFYINVASATNYGVEAEVRTLLGTLLGIKKDNSVFNKITLAANAAYIKSNVKVEGIPFFDPKKFVSDRPLQGQSPYLINGSITYAEEKLGLSSTISVNRVGDRLAVSGNYLVPELHERARTVMDFQIAKTFLKSKMEIRFNAKDLLSQDFRFYSDNDYNHKFSEADVFFSVMRAPKTFSLSITYKL